MQHGPGVPGGSDGTRAFGRSGRAAIAPVIEKPTAAESQPQFARRQHDRDESERPKAIPPLERAGTTSAVSAKSAAANVLARILTPVSSRWPVSSTQSAIAAITHRAAPIVIDRRSNRLRRESHR
jgi:hypothetical protein